MNWTINLSNKEGFVKELLNVDFIKIEYNKNNGILVSMNRQIEYIKKYLGYDWLFQIHLDKETKCWYIVDLESITNCKDISEIQKLLEIINTFSTSVERKKNE